VTRPSGRGSEELREISYELDYLRWAEGSVLFSMGETRVLCAATFEPEVPRFLRGSGKGWVTAEYSMLPRATQERTPREVSKGRPSGRTQEIQRLIGRSLRAVTDLSAMGEGMVVVDCDVLQADGGTRTASITGGYIALARAIGSLRERGAIASDPLKGSVAAVSVGLVDGEAALDLDYDEDSRAEVDFNVVMTHDGRLVEVQGTAEGEPFSREALDGMLDLAHKGIERLSDVQRDAVTS